MPTFHADADRFLLDSGGLTGSVVELRVEAIRQNVLAAFAINAARRHSLAWTPSSLAADQKAIRNHT